MRQFSESAQERQDRLMAALDERLNETVGGRADLYISDVLGLDADACYALIKYTAGLPVPTTANLVEWLGREFNGKIRPVLETARHFEDHNAVCLMLAKHVPTRPLEDTAEMATVVAGARYLDVDMRDTWSVATTPDGKQFLRRVSDDDVTKIVHDRKHRLAQAGQIDFTCANAIGAGSSIVDVGDIVRCYYQGSMFPDCEIKKVMADNRLSVQIPKVGNVTVARESVEIQAVSKQKAGQMKSKLAEYYKKALPDPKYAAELTKELIDEGADSAMPSYWPEPHTKKSASKK